jgi:hypothetical protein
MEKDYTIFDLIDFWQDDIDSFILESIPCESQPSINVLENILAYARSSNPYAIFFCKSSPNFNRNIKLCLN